MSWRDSALCAQTDPAIFFPEKGASTREAKSVCKVCPVIRECRESVLASPWEEHGVWADLSMMERRKLRPNARPAVRTSCDIAGCDEPHVAKGYCKSHYNRLARGTSCTVGGCGRKHHAKGQCKWHYNRTIRPKYVAS